jgi:hypothetical protein
MEGRSFGVERENCEQTDNIPIESNNFFTPNATFLKGAWILKSGRLAARGAISWLIFHSITSLTFPAQLEGGRKS